MFANWNRNTEASASISGSVPAGTRAAAVRSLAVSAAPAAGGGIGGYSARKGSISERGQADADQGEKQRLGAKQRHQLRQSP